MCSQVWSSRTTPAAWPILPPATGLLPVWLVLLQHTISHHNVVSSRDGPVAAHKHNSLPLQGGARLDGTHVQFSPQAPDGSSPAHIGNKLQALK